MSGPVVTICAGAVLGGWHRVQDGWVWSRDDWSATSPQPPSHCAVYHCSMNPAR
jgi:hypothetical protein